MLAPRSLFTAAPAAAYSGPVTRNTCRLAAIALVAMAALALAPAAPVIAATGSAGDDLTAATWDAALALSQQHHKTILIDFFTKW